MSKVLGIIAEYNPFHNGHLYHIKKSIEETGASSVICVMSGNFVQRGNTSIVKFIISMSFDFVKNNFMSFGKSN